MASHPASETIPKAAGTVRSANSSPATDSVTRKSVDGIPLDVWPEVWFDDPLAVASLGTPVETARAVAPPVSAESALSPAEEPVAASPDMPASTASEPWDKVVSAAVLDAEIKRLRNSLNQSLQSVGRYNANRADIKVDASTLAAVAGMVARHPAPVRWKDNAKYVRDLAADVASAASKPGGDAYREARAAFDPIVDILDGNQPANLPAAAEMADFSETASRNGLMKRMDAAYRWMKTNITDERSLKKESDPLNNEAGMTAALAQVILSEGYDGADEQEYQDHLRQIITACGTITSAAKQKRIDEFDKALADIQRSCNECHAEYRFAGG